MKLLGMSAAAEHFINHTDWIKHYDIDISLIAGCIVVEM